ncbi:MAG TPA: hypothetical protein VG035_00845 [Actinomycetota bacterium]|nr:hypothetical protein [Actinomycetota bacterium]
MQVQGEVDVLEAVLAEVTQGRPLGQGPGDQPRVAPDTITCPPAAAPATLAARFTSMPT